MSDRLSLSLYRSPTQPLRSGFSSHKNITVRLNSTKYVWQAIRFKILFDTSNKKVINIIDIID